MIEEIKNINTDKKEIRKFGFLVGGVLVAISIFLLWKGLSYFQLVLVIGVSLILLGFFIPKNLKPLYIIWMTLATILGWIMTRVILTILFYLIVTPIGLVARMFGAKFLNLSWHNNVNSHWNKRDKSISDIEKQF
ncbi:MAG: sxtJ [Planctomycetia bacterium]|nr:sxtJ [Planctomycetia bacterium]